MNGEPVGKQQPTPLKGKAMTDRIVEIIAEYPSGPRTAFIGYLAQAAHRQGLSSDSLTRAIILKLPLKQTPLAARDYYGWPLYASWPAAQRYYARWREA